MNTKQLALLGALGGAAVIQAYDNGLVRFSLPERDIPRMQT